MFYAQTKDDPATVVYVVAFDGGKAIVMAEDGTLSAVALSSLVLPDANRATPYPTWPSVVVKEE